VDYRSTDIRRFELLFENPVENLSKEIEQIWSRTQSEWQERFCIKWELPVEPEKWSVYWQDGYVAESGLEVVLNSYAVSLKSLNRLNCVFDPAILNSAIILWDSSINPTDISW